MANETTPYSPGGDRPFDIDRAILQIQKRAEEISDDERAHYEDRVRVWTVFEKGIDTKVSEGELELHEAQRLRAQDRAQRELNARKDPLLKILTKGALQDELTQELELPSSAQGLTLALLDIDHFSAINNTFGHNAGDEVLQTMTSYYTENLPPGSTMGKWGGEEFIAFFRKTTVNQVYPIMQDLNDYLPDALVETSRRIGIHQPITMSVGITQYRPGERVLQLVGRADSLMYQAKRAGRNRVFHDQMNTR